MSAKRAREGSPAGRKGPVGGSHADIIASELALSSAQTTAVIRLLAEGSTVPFIARYRKENTSSLDEIAITSIRDRLDELVDLDARKDAIIKSLTQRDLLTQQLDRAIRNASHRAELEDLYLPYRLKRTTRATAAREKGLEPLALLLLEGGIDGEISAHAAAAAYLSKDGIGTIDDALSGARDIIAEMVSEDPKSRADVRRLYKAKGVIVSRVTKGRESDGAKYSDYFAWSEHAERASSHRVHAMLRGQSEGVLKLKIDVDSKLVLDVLKRRYIGKGFDQSYADQISLAIEDGCKRLLSKSIATQMWSDLKKRADEKAIRVFGANLRELLLSAPLGQKPVLAIDPGFRTGCKTVCLDTQGKLIHHDTLYPHSDDSRVSKAGNTIRELCSRFGIEAIAIGNGTAGRETEAFVKGLEPGIPVVMVNESGASIYSASEAARKEFPDHDITVRGAVSIGRRLMDPLAELIKIDPKAIGVGQYQHDVDQKLLQRCLDDTVMSCVNAVGVDVNTASAHLLTYVSGLGPQLAAGIVAYRDENGAFHNRKQLLRVPKLGAKAFEQAAGFLRIRNGNNALDASAVHPESYHVVMQMAKDTGCDVADLMGDAEKRSLIDIERYIAADIGLPTLSDIMTELAKPGRDPREQFDPVNFDEGIQKIEDVRPGMVIDGIVTNVTAFGAFVDIGVHQDGLVHISEMADRFVRDPSEIVNVQQHVRVTVLDVDVERKRIGLSMKRKPD